MESIYPIEFYCQKQTTRLVKEWVEERQTALNKAWKKAIACREVPWIKPIK